MNQSAPGLPEDGAPLTRLEECILGRIEMDAMIGVPESVYEQGRAA